MSPHAHPSPPSPSAPPPPHFPLSLTLTFKLTALILINFFFSVSRSSFEIQCLFACYGWVRWDQWFGDDKLLLYVNYVVLTHLKVLKVSRRIPTQSNV